MKWWTQAVWNANTEQGSGAPTPDTGAPPTGGSAASHQPDLPGGNELSPEALADFVQMAEEGGLSDRIGGNEDFPDLAPVEAPVAPVAPVQVPASPAQAPAAKSPPPAAVQAAAAPAQAPAAVAAVPPAAPAVATPPAAAPAVTQAAQVSPAPAQAPASAVESVTSDPFDALARQIGSQAEAFIGALAEREYPITAEAHEAFIGGDTKQLSQLCAKIHVNAVNSVLNAVSKLMPVMVDGLMSVRQQEADRENRFWEANPHLSRAQHRQLLAPVLRTYNQLNPQASEAERYKAVGLLVAQMHNIPLVAQAQQAAAGVPAQPQVVRTPGPVVRSVSPPGFAPASAGGGPAALAQASPAPNGAWDGFVDFALANERGLFDGQG